jgi:hypothetical protein
MHELYELKEKLMKELAEYSKEELTTGSLEVIDKLAHAIKNICKVCEDMEGSSYEGRSSYGRRSYEGSRRSYDMSREGSNRSYDGSYDGESSYRRGRGRYARRDSMGRYAAEGPELAMELKELMQDAPEESKQDFKRLIQKIEQM